MRQIIGEIFNEDLSPLIQCPPDSGCDSLLNGLRFVTKWVAIRGYLGAGQTLKSYFSNFLAEILKTNDI